jgi:outer membrane putative beta-barrel porin/alpha-amylase
MRASRWLALLGFAIPLSALGDVADLFPSLVQQAQLQVTPIVTIQGGNDPGTFLALNEVTGNFDSSSTLSNLNSQVASQFQRFPVGSTVAAFTFQFDPELNVFRRSTEGLGPLLSDRAQTIGKGKINVSFAYSHVDFSVFEGDDLDDIELGYAGALGVGQTQDDNSIDFNPDSGGARQSNVILLQNFAISPGTPIVFTDPDQDGIISDPGIVGFHSGAFQQGSISVADVRSILDAQLDVDVFAFFLNYGVTDWLDVGAIVPLLYVDAEGKVTTCDTTSGACLVTTKDSDDSFGFGDILLRAKARLFTTPFVDGALRGDVTLPTGDEDEFRGYGDPSFGPSLLFSKTFGILSPHANMGLNFRTDDTDQHTYRWAVGTDVQPFEVLTLTADVIGEHLMDRGQDVGEDIFGVAAGLKVNPWGRLVVSGNALVRLNGDGLRADAIPSFAIEYTF